MAEATKEGLKTAHYTLLSQTRKAFRWDTLSVVTATGYFFIFTSHRFLLLSSSQVDVEQISAIAISTCCHPVTCKHFRNTYGLATATVTRTIYQATTSLFITSCLFLVSDVNKLTEAISADGDDFSLFVDVVTTIQPSANAQIRVTDSDI